MRRVRVLQAVVLLAWLDSGCTFYTACPNNTNPSPSAGTNNGTGGSNTNTGGTSSNTAGTSIVSGGMAPTGEWANETFNLTGMDSECGNVSVFSVKPDEDLLLLTVAQHGVFGKASDDQEWRPLGTGKGSATIINRGSAFIYDPDNPKTFWESGIYNGDGVYRTDDDGDTFVDLQVPHNDYVTVDFTDPDRKTLLASGHEQPHRLYRTKDGGATMWEQIGDKIPDEAQVCSFPVIIDSMTYLLGCATYGGGAKTIWRSEDAGDTWDKVSDHAGGAAPLFASDGTIYFAGEPRDGIVKSSDQGKTWSDALGSGELWQAHPIELPDGRIAALGQKHILVSADQGETWRIVTTDVPYDATGIGYSAVGKKLYLYHFSCTPPVPEDAIQSYPFDYKKD